MKAFLLSVGLGTRLKPMTVAVQSLLGRLS